MYIELKKTDHPDFGEEVLVAIITEGLNTYSYDFATLKSITHSDKGTKYEWLSKTTNKVIGNNDTVAYWSRQYKLPNHTKNT